MGKYRPKSLPVTMTFHDCCFAIMRHRECKALNYAVAYAIAGLSMTDPDYIRAQIPYILNNMTHWRGDIAVNVRNELKRIQAEMN